MANSRKRTAAKKTAPRKRAVIEADEPAETFEQAALRKEIAMADKHEMEAATRRGELVEAATVAQEWADICTNVKNSVLAVPDRIALKCEGQTARVIRETMMSELRAALHAVTRTLEQSAA